MSDSTTPGQLPKYYVYMLCDAKGKPFYIGKGTGRRIEIHEREAQTDCRCVKCDYIRMLWKRKEQVQRQIVFRTDDDRLARDEESRLIEEHQPNGLVNKQTLSIQRVIGNPHKRGVNYNAMGYPRISRVVIHIEVEESLRKRQWYEFKAQTLQAAISDAMAFIRGKRWLLRKS